MDAMRMFSQTTWPHQLLLQRRGCRVHSASIIRGLFSSGGLLRFQPLVNLERFQAGLIDLLSLGVTPFVSLCFQPLVNLERFQAA